MFMMGLLHINNVLKSSLSHENEDTQLPSLGP